MSGGFILRGVQGRWGERGEIKENEGPQAFSPWEVSVSGVTDFKDLVTRRVSQTLESTGPQFKVNCTCQAPPLPGIHIHTVTQPGWSPLGSMTALSLKLWLGVTSSRGRKECHR